MQRKKEVRSQSKYLRLLSDTGIFIIGNFLAKLIQYFLLPLYTSAMSSDSYGTAELLNNLSELLFPIVTLAIYEAVFRFAVERDQDFDALLYESTGLLCKIFLGIFLIALCFQKLIQYAYTYELLFVLAAYSFRMLFANYARGRGYTKVFSLSGVVNALALAVFSWTFLIWLNLGVQGYLLALGCAHMVSLFVLLFGAGIPKRLLIHKKDKELLRRMLQFSVPMILNNSAWWVTSMSGRYAVLFAYGVGLAGLYAAANKLPAVISAFSQVFQQAWQLNSAREYQSKDHTVFYENVWRLYSSLILLFGAFAILLTPFLAQMTLKNEFFEARHYIPLMMMGVMIHCLSAYFGSLLIAYKNTKMVSRGMMLGAVANLLLLVVLVIPFGIWGVLTASVACYLAILIHRVLSVRKQIQMNLHIRRIAILLFLVFAETILMSFDSGLCRLLSFCICGIILVSCMIAFRDPIKTLLKRKRP